MLKFLFVFLFTLLSAQETVRICLIETKGLVRLSFKNKAVLEAEEARYQLTNSNEPMTVSAENGNIIFAGEGEFKRKLIFKKDQSFYLKASAENYISIDDKFNEEDKLFFNISDLGYLQIICEMDLERYTKFVLPNEMISNYSSDLEALKAQAVSIRSYVLKNKNKYKIFDSHSDTRDQVYLSNTNINENVINAVTATAGEVLLYNNLIVNTSFCSSLGGLQEKPYYFTSDMSFNPNMLLEDGTLVGAISPWYKWRYAYSLETIKKHILANFSTLIPLDSTLNYSIDFEILKRTETGRVSDLKIKQNTSEVILQKLDIRKLFPTAKGFLPSNLFKFETTADSLIIMGGGNGHGLGLGQWEAIDLSRRNYSYRNILRFFYPNTEIGK